MPWKRARKLIKEDMRYKSFTDSDYVRESVLLGKQRNHFFYSGSVVLCVCIA